MGSLYLPIRWPKNVPTRPEVEQGVLVASIEGFCDAGRTLTGKSHPIVGPLTAAQWLRWGYLHMDHHLRQFGL